MNGPLAIRQGRQRGFTLMEVLVALVILAVALGALMRVAGQQADTAAHLQQRSVAHWVAMNALVSMELDPPTAAGNRDGVQHQLGQDWHWRAQLIASADDNVLRTRISVFGVAAQPIYTLDAYLPTAGANQGRVRSP